MPKVLQIRNLPDDVHRALAVKAALAGMSLSAYAARTLAHDAAKPTLDDFVKLLPGRGADLDADEVVRVLRHDRQQH